MKKTLLFFALAICVFTTKAQFFQHLYGSGDFENLSSGINTVALGNGHFMAGTRGNSTLFVSTVVSTRSNGTGAVPGAPYFDNEYVISNAGGTPVHAHDAKVFEMNNGAGFGIIGQYVDATMSGPGNSGVFYLRLAPNGAPTGISAYTIIPAGTTIWDVQTVGGVSESANGVFVYVTGATFSNVPQYDAYAMKINVATGGIVWSRVYNFNNAIGGSIPKNFGNDIIESPYLPVGVPEAVIVGHIYENSQVLSDGFFLRVNANTGIPVIGGTLNHYGTAAIGEMFTSIAVANSPTGGNGFVVGGFTDLTGDYDFWVLKLNPTGGVIWTNTYDYSLFPTANNHCMDVIERLNTFAVHEYYAAGTTDNGAMGGNDMLVVKIDDFGTGVADYTYGSTGNESGRSLDQYNGTAVDGLSVFGSWDSPGGLGNADMYQVKAYFNGLSGCFETFGTPFTVTGPNLLARYRVTLYTQFTPASVLVTTNATADINLCSGTFVPGGNNARIAPAKTGDDAVLISPNPMQTGAALVNVEVESENPTEVSIAVYDMLGKEYYNSTFMLAKGKNTLPLDLSNANMAAGMYNVRITGANDNRNLLLMVK